MDPWSWISRRNSRHISSSSTKSCRVDNPHRLHSIIPQVSERVSDCTHYQLLYLHTSPPQQAMEAPPPYSSEGAEYPNSMLSRKFGREVVNYFSGTQLLPLFPPKALLTPPQVLPLTGSLSSAPTPPSSVPPSPHPASSSSTTLTLSHLQKQISDGSNTTPFPP